MHECKSRGNLSASVLRVVTVLSTAFSLAPLLRPRAHSNTTGKARACAFTAFR